MKQIRLYLQIRNHFIFCKAERIENKKMLTSRAVTVHVFITVNIIIIRYLIHSDYLRCLDLLFSVSLSSVSKSDVRCAFCNLRLAFSKSSARQQRISGITNIMGAANIRTNKTVTFTNYYYKTVDMI